MGNYYGVTRSDQYLAHYGVKGMKWGVRKAIDRVSSFHSPSYHRVKDKLEALQKRKEDKQVAKIQRYAAQGRNRKVKKAYAEASERMEELRNNANREYQRGQFDQNKEDASNRFWWDESGRIMGNKSMRVISAIDRHKSRKRLTDKGHAKAVQERDAYARQMKRMFRNTQYDTSKKRR